MNFFVYNLRKISIWRISRKCKKFAKRALKESTQQRYSLQFRYDYLLNKIKKILKWLKIEVVIKGEDEIPNNGPILFYGNHLDNIDPLVLMYATKSKTDASDDFNKVLTFFAKEELQYKAITRNLANVINTFYIKRDDFKKSLIQMNEFGKFIKENKNYGVIFPSGTRTTNNIGEFKAGSFKVAKKEYIPIIPFTINNSVQGFNPRRNEKLVIEVIFHKKINPSSFINQDTSALAKRVEEVVKSSFVLPKLEPLTDKTINKEELLKSKAKWEKKEAKKEAKKIKKENKEKQIEQKLEKEQIKQDEKFAKKEAKKKSKNKKIN